MEQPEGTIKVGDEGKVMRLLKCLYGLKKSPRQWNILIDTVLKKLGNKRLLSDVGIYVKGEGVDAVTLPYMSMICSLWGSMSNQNRPPRLD